MPYLILAKKLVVTIHEKINFFSLLNKVLLIYELTTAMQ